VKKSTVIYGPPGTGKSTEIIRRMSAAIEQGIPAERIGLCSFTKAAAQELAHRVGVPPGKNIATLHSFAFRACGMIREQVIDRPKLLEFSKIVKIETTGASIYDQEQLGPGDYYLTTYNYMRSILEDDTKRAFSATGSQGSLVEFEYFIKTYEKWKKAFGYMDFSDMLERAIDNEPPAVDILFLDEAQDFSPAQWKLINSWLPHIDEVVLALDDDQTLYKFTGADPDGGPAFEREHRAERVVLNKSYRVPSNIHSLATRLIHNVANRVDKQYDPVADGGVVKFYGNLEAVSPPDPEEDTMILFRNHSLRKEIEGWLIDRGIPYTTDNGAPGPLQNRIMAAINAWKQAQQDFENAGRTFLDNKKWAALKRHCKPAYISKIRDEDIEAIIGKHWAHVLNIPPNLSYFYKKVEAKYGRPDPATGVKLTTIHGSKGREAYRVILLNAMSERTAESASHDPDPEIRAFYVGVTRTKMVLDIVNGDNPLRVLR
jgi:superfamily I DNA/RNA helicase